MNLKKGPPVTDDIISRFENLQVGTLPLEYLEFLKKTNGGYGFIGNESYVILWQLEEIGFLNKAYEVQKYVPGLLLFGSNGGGESYGFDIRKKSWNIVQIPFVGMSWDLAQPLAKSFNQFLNYLYDINSADNSSKETESSMADFNENEIFEITPVILGGNPIDPANKIILNREKHIQAVKYWNGIVRKLRKNRQDS